MLEIIRSAPGTDAEWMISAAVNRGITISNEGRPAEAEKHLSGALRLVKAFGALNFREAEIITALRSVQKQKLALMQSQDQ